jgi:HTH-type transcriptional regulator/antitoxin HigA
VLALVLGVEETAVYRLISDKRTMDAGTALLLGEVFEVPPERFLELQQSYDLAKARISARPDPDRSHRARLFAALPVGEMIKRGWLDVEDVRDWPRVEAALTSFFQASSLDEIEILPHAAKKTNVTEGTTPAQLAWLYRVKEIANEMLAPRYSPVSARHAVAKLSALLNAPEEARKAPRILAECGIRYVIVEPLTSTKIDGVCFWLNDECPVIAMSLRFDRIDNFWFVLRHELEHVLRSHGRSVIAIDTELDGPRAGVGQEIEAEERLANAAAADFCVPKELLQRFVARKEPFFAERDIIGFSRTLKIHPGLVAGQIQHYTGKYKRFRSHLAPVRSIVSLSATVDGWGDIAPVGK